MKKKNIVHKNQHDTIRTTEFFMVLKKYTIRPSTDHRHAHRVTRTPHMQNFSPCLCRPLALSCSCLALFYDPLFFPPSMVRHLLILHISLSSISLPTDQIDDHHCFTICLLRILVPWWIEAALSRSMALLLSIGGGSLHDDLDTECQFSCHQKPKACWGAWRRQRNGSSVLIGVETGVLFYQVAVSIRCIFFLPLGSLSVWFSLGRMVNQRQHVLLNTNIFPLIQAI